MRFVNRRDMLNSMHAEDRWHHVIINTRGSWLHGDPRGFRDRHHRIHSSGDYHDPPPPDEHQALHRYYQQRSQGVIIIPADQRPVAALAMIRKITAQYHDLLVLSVGAMHAHMLVKLPPHRPTIHRIVGGWKQAASLALPIKGRIWSGGCESILIRDEEHHRNVFNYVSDHVLEGAWVRHFRDGQRPELRSHAGSED